jgi:hypothetical protein
MSDRMSDSYSMGPAGTRWCPHCSGCGSPLKEVGERCSPCGGTGLSAVADPEERLGNGHEPGRLRYAE